MTNARTRQPFIGQNLSQIGKQDYGFWDTAGATYSYNYMPITRWAHEMLEFGSEEFDQSYRWEEDVEGYENHVEYLSKARNKNHMSYLKTTLDMARANREIIDRGSLFGLTVASIVDPLNVAFGMPVFNTALKTAWRAKSAFGVTKEAGKLGFAFGAAQESLRAPFDPLSTPLETTSNIIGSTITSGLLVGGLRGIGNISRPKVKLGLDKLQAFAYSNQKVPTEYNGVPIVKQSKGTKRSDGTVVHATYSQKDNKIYWDEAKLKEQFKDRPWTKPKLKGVAPLPDNLFSTPDEWARFVLQHEMAHVDNPFQTVKQLMESTNPAYAKKPFGKADYENHINDIAIERFSEGYGIKQTGFTTSWFFDVMTTPQKRILNDPTIPNEIKRNTVRSFWNASLDLEGNIDGKGVQSLAARAMSYGADYYNLEADLKQLWRSEIKGFDKGGDVLGVNVDNVKTRLGSYGDGAKTFEEWQTNIFDLLIDSHNPSFNKQILANLPKTSTEAIEKVKTFLKGFYDDANEVGILGTKNNLQKKMNFYQKKVDIRKAEIEKEVARKDKANQNKIKALKTANAQDEKEITFLTGLLDEGPEQGFFPVYYNKVLLKESEQAQRELTQIYRDHLMSGGILTRWDNEKGQWVKSTISNFEEADNIAANMVQRITEEPDMINMMPTSGKGKHLLRRTMDIPEWKIKDFIVRDGRVMQNYANKMGFRIEWAGVHGKMTIEDVLNRHEYVMRVKGMDEERIAEVRRDFLADYEREAGIHIQEPDAWNQTVVRNLKSIAGMTYLPLAGVTSLIDAIAMPIFQHGFKNVFKAGMAVVDGQWGAMKLNSRQVKHGYEAMEIERPIAQYRLLTESVRDLQPRRTERTIQSAEKGFYLANGLSIITAMGKRINTAILIPEFFRRIQLIKNNGKITQWEVNELARYGITEDVARKIADQPWGKTESGMPTLDLRQWSSETYQDRALKRTMSTYLAQHARNTIMHSTSADRPIIMDGVLYARWKPWMQQAGLKIDERASTASVKYVRIENAMLSLPFQFLNFAFAANNRILGAVLDPAKQHRLAGIISLLGMSYLILKLKKDDWWFENKSVPEILMRTVDQSGITGVYSDIAYHGLHTAIATGLHKPDNSWLKGKYKPTMDDDFVDKFGAVPSMIHAWVKNAHEMTTGNTMEGFRNLTYHVPVFGLYGMSEDVRSLTRN